MVEIIVSKHVRIEERDMEYNIDRIEMVELLIERKISHENYFRMQCEFKQIKVHIAWVL